MSVGLGDPPLRKPLCKFALPARAPILGHRPTLERGDLAAAVADHGAGTAAAGQALQTSPKAERTRRTGRRHGHPAVSIGDPG